MTDDLPDRGPSIEGLWAAASILGLAAGGCLLRLLTCAADGVPVQPELFVWALTGMIASVFSAACAVLAGVRSSEERLARRVGAGER